MNLGDDRMLETPKILVQKLYGNEASLNVEDFSKKFNICIDGLSSNTAAHNIEKYGLNELKGSKPKRWYNYFFECLLSPFNCILLGIVGVLLYTDVYLPPKPSFANIIVILILVIASTLLEFFEEYHSNKAAQKLKELVETTTIALRDGKEQIIPIKDVTIGDIILLSAGSMIPADLRVIESRNLHVSQSALTGESEPVRKSSNINLNLSEIHNISDLENICFMGTNVISGSAKCAVIKIGNNTYFGKIAKSLTSHPPKNTFQREIENISKLLIRFMLVLTPIVFVLNVWKHSPITAFTFAIAIAICITPLLLPVVLSSSLSNGAIRMSKKGTIIKKLDSVESFGSMNLLCTDKTGTLTEDKIVLEKYLDIYGNEDLRILKHAFLNSYFQTGLRGNIDEAVVSRALSNNMTEYINKYKLIDEIPFDFVRRRLSVIVSDGIKQQMITKGAVEEILGLCTLVDYKGNVFPITNEIKEDILNTSKQMNKDGLRVVAVCQKNNLRNTNTFDISDETEMILLGFIGFLDPPKESAKSAIEKLNQAGIRVIVLTGDNLEVTRCICEKVGINSEEIIDGNRIDQLEDQGVAELLRNNNIFVKLSPIQKARIVRLLKEYGNVVGYVGDGINDAPSLSSSDVGISVDTAVDIAKESAHIILLEKDLHVLLDGVREGRKTFCNLMKYIKLATSFNFGEVMSVIIASVLLPFLPETPIQLLLEGLLYDIGQLTLPFDNVDADYLYTPRQFRLKSLKTFMLFMGPLSSVFDLLVFAFLWFVYGLREAALFQTIWFTYSIVSNLLGLHIIRTQKKPFIESNAHKLVYLSSISLVFIGIAIPYTWLGQVVGLVPIPLKYLTIVLGVPLLYCIVALIAKKFYVRKFGEWI